MTLIANDCHLSTTVLWKSNPLLTLLFLLSTISRTFSAEAKTLSLATQAQVHHSIVIYTAKPLSTPAPSKPRFDQGASDKSNFDLV